MEADGDGRRRDGAAALGVRGRSCRRTGERRDVDLDAMLRCYD